MHLQVQGPLAGYHVDGLSAGLQHVAVMASIIDPSRPRIPSFSVRLHTEHTCQCVSDYGKAEHVAVQHCRLNAVHVSVACM